MLSNVDDNSESMRIKKHRENMNLLKNVVEEEKKSS